MLVHLAAAFYHLTDGLHAAPARGLAGFYHVAVAIAIENGNDLGAWGKPARALSNEPLCQSRSQLRTRSARNKLIGPTLTGSGAPLLVDAPPHPRAPSPNRL